MWSSDTGTPRALQMLTVKMRRRGPGASNRVVSLTSRPRVKKISRGCPVECQRLKRTSPSHEVWTPRHGNYFVIAEPVSVQRFKLWRSMSTCPICLFHPPRIINVRRSTSSTRRRTPLEIYSLASNINGHLCGAPMTDLSIVHPSKTPDQMDKH